MPSLVVDDAPVDAVDVAVKTNGVKVNGVHADEPSTTPVEPVATPAVADAPSTSDAVVVVASETKEEEAKKEDETDETRQEREMKARKKELDALNEEYKDIPHGSKAELVHLDKRWDHNGDEYYVRQKKAELRTSGSDWWQKHVLVVIRHFDDDEPERVVQTTVEVYSDYLRKTLAKVIGTYPAISFHTEHISLTLPVECLYHYFSELRAEAETLQKDSVELVHFNILLNFIETQFAKTVEQVNNLRPQNLISYDTMTIPALPFAPLEMRTRKEEIRMALMKRGQRFQSMRGQCHGEYVGVAIEQGSEFDKKFGIKSRVMIDGTSYNRICANFSWEAPEDEEAAEALFWAEDSLSAEEFAVFKTKLAAEKAARGLTEEETLLATNVLRGFSFSEKKWFLLFIDNYSEIVWNEASFDRLVLPDASKTLIRALVSSHLRTEESKFDDIIKGKGRGLVTVLHGSPGVGKTLTAECIAEYTRRPLYVVSSGDLGTSASHLEQELTRILDLAHTWRAVLLIDEADVFLEKRTLTDVHRNALVSVFLRLLEYYEGILFLTTNRVNTFDPAFQSRIHMALKYENLEHQARKRLWKDFLSKLNGGAGAVFSDEGYDALAKYDINGRQIKNAVKTAESLASFMEKPLNLEYLETVLKTQADFAEAFVGNEF
ncbi:P-loop containing nucleoside triphosphate hydrolase protein [Mycena haematopus]|nr:P-loop containing nucleoside triphosphate hydrolase protein [Mycena haematopus]